MNTFVARACALVFAFTLVPACSLGDDEDQDQNTRNGLEGQPAPAAEETTPPAPAAEETTPPVACPAVAAPHASQCPGGSWVETKNDRGCPAFECVVCPAIAAPHASQCQGGTWVETKNDRGCPAFECRK